MKKIAIVTDTGSDINVELAKEKDIELLPLYINYRDHSYKDMTEITPQEVYDRFEEEVPKTSIASVAEIEDRYQELLDQGAEHILHISISSGLSGFYNAARLATEKFDEETICLIDSKNIAFGIGLLAVYASDLRAQGMAFEELCEQIKSLRTQSNLYFTVETLKYLIKGGRIGLVSGVLGEVLNIRPIIECNEDGVYHTVAKMRGEKKVRRRMVELVREAVEGKSHFYLTISHGDCKETFLWLKNELLDVIDRADFYYENQITASLGVHTGPGLYGIGILTP